MRKPASEVGQCGFAGVGAVILIRDVCCGLQECRVFRFLLSELFDVRLGPMPTYFARGVETLIHGRSVALQAGF